MRVDRAPVWLGALKRPGALAVAILAVLGGWELLQGARGTGALLGSFSLKWTIVLGGYFAFLLSVFLLCLSIARMPTEQIETALGSLARKAGRLGRTRGLCALAVALLPTLLLLGPWGERLTMPALRGLLAVGCGAAAGLLWRGEPRDLASRAGLGILCTGAAFLLTERLMLVSDYPFKLGWSEGNRLWDYSLYFLGDQYDVFGEFRFPGYLTPGRHGLWGLPFLIPHVSIGIVRLWDALLWTVPYFLLGWLLFARLMAGAPRKTLVGLALWTLLYLSQGPIYTPLVLGMILVLLTYSRRRFWLSLSGVALAGFYTGLSRWTWMAAPAMWAALLAVMDVEWDKGHRWWRSLGRPAALALVGLAGGLLAQRALGATWLGSGEGESVAFDQPLLWYRLFPNATLKLGILLNLLLAVGPLIGLLIVGLRRRWIAWHVLTHSAVWGALGVSLAVGLVISVKMGGGSNLHNLDLFLLTLLLVAGRALAPSFGARLRSPDHGSGAACVLGSAALVIPVFFAVVQGSYIRLPNDEIVRSSLEQVQQATRLAAQEGEVLFFDQRQLFTFGHLTGVPLSMDYEMKDVMNQAMAGNTPFFERLRADLVRGRYRMIVAPPQTVVWHGKGHPFGEEDDAWVRNVTLLLLEFYKPVQKFDEVGLWLMAPK
ncbi:MAG TPA: hypothetical protein VJ123_08680 [Anaerolineales bacterium]|nr:hypothetical protein [Anaerolineales bacterium]